MEVKHILQIKSLNNGILLILPKLRNIFEYRTNQAYLAIIIRRILHQGVVMLSK